MSRQQFVFPWALLGGFGLALVVCLSVLTLRYFANQESRSPKEPVMHRVENDPGSVLSYWTDEKMRQTKKSKMPHLQGEKQQTALPSTPTDSEHS